MEKNSFIMYTEYSEQIELLNMEQRGALLTAMLAYQSGNDIPDMDGMTSMCFAFIKARMDRDAEAYAERCRKNAENAKKGGRLKKGQLYTETGKLVPSGEISGAHFLYLIRDVTTGEYKIGETKNLEQRRYDIKRPTNNLVVVDYVIGNTGDCQDAERAILDRYKDKNTGGDWFVADDEMAGEILSEWFSKKPNGFSEKRTISKKPDTDTDIDTDKEKAVTKVTAKKKHKHGALGNVMLTDDEFNRLAVDYGEAMRDECIVFLDEYIAEKGYKSKSHNLAIRRWVASAVEERKARRNPNRSNVTPMLAHGDDYDEIAKRIAQGG